MATRKRSHKELTLKRRIKLIEEAESKPKPTQEDLAKRFGIGRSTVSDILRKHLIYWQSWEENRSCKRQRLSKETDLSSLNQLVYDFFRQARAKGIVITGRLLQAKAADYATSLNIEGFKASNGWLGCWKGRYDVKQFKRCGEGADVDELVVMITEVEFQALFQERMKQKYLIVMKLG